MGISETELLALVAGFLWPFLRVGALEFLNPKSKIVNPKSLSL